MIEKDKDLLLTEAEIKSFDSSGFVVKASEKTQEQIEEEVSAKAQKKIILPSLMKRIISTGTDLLLTVFGMLLLMAWAAQPILAIYEQPIFNEILSHQISSGLFVVRDSDPLTPSSSIFSAKVYYGPFVHEASGEDRIWTINNNGTPQQPDVDLGYQYAGDALISQIYAFYNEYLTENPGNIIPDTFSFVGAGGSKIYDKKKVSDEGFDLSLQTSVLGLLRTDIHGDISNWKTYFTPEWFNYRFLGLPLTNASGNLVRYGDATDSGLFAYKQDPITLLPITNELGIINPSLSMAGNYNNQKRVYEYLAGQSGPNETGNNPFDISLNIFANMPFYKSYLNNIDWIEVLGWFCSFSVAYVIFLFILPVACRNGETLGLMITRSILLNKKDFKVKRIQVAARQALLFVELISGLLSVGLLLAVWLCVFIFSKNNKTLHDMFAGTKVIDKDRSVWFNSDKEEFEFQETIRKDIEYLRNNSRNLDSPNRECITKPEDR